MPEFEPHIERNLNSTFLTLQALFTRGDVPSEMLDEVEASLRQGAKDLQDKKVLSQSTAELIDGVYKRVLRAKAKTV